MINRDPYGAGRLAVMRPVDWPAARAALINGPEVAGPYCASLAAEQFSGPD